MPTERLPMRKAKEILRLKYEVGLSHREIGRALSVSAGVVGATVARAKAAALDWSSMCGMSEEDVERSLYSGPGRQVPDVDRALPDFAKVHAERRKVGVTMQLLHIEYRQENPQGYGYTQFCEHYRRWLQTRGLSMRQTHRAGEKVFVDYSGKKASIFDSSTGEEHEVELFVGVLGASNFTYAEVTRSQTLPDFIASHERMFAYFGGVPGALVPDQLKSAVTVASRYEPGINRTYQDFAEHYGTAVVPARPAKPKDKAKVEGGVLIAQRWILARLRHQRFFSLIELNERVRELVDEMNARTMRRYGRSRRELFEAVDRPALRPLPSTSYAYATWSRVTVGRDYHIDIDGHGYSVPHERVGQKVEVRLTATVVEVLLGGRRLTVHARSLERGQHTTKPDHQPVAHRRHAEWTPDRIRHWASEIGPSTQALVVAILEERPHPEQGYRACLALLRLSRRYGEERLERACARALQARARSASHVESILKNGLDRLVPMPSEAPIHPVMHENVRGPSAYEN